ncbi:hypothetical protein HDU98_008597, partial [Podochytrium sp. JEL0797]
MNEEKELTKATKALGKQHSQVAKALTAWGRAEDEDVKMITNHLATLDTKMGELHSWMADEIEHSREILKTVLLREESLATLKKRHRDLQSKLDTAIKKNASNCDALRAELSAMDTDVMAAMVEFESFKRDAMRDSSRRKWNAVMEFSAKMMGVARCGNLVVDRISMENDVPTTRNDLTIPQIMSDFESHQQTQWRTFLPTNLTPTNDATPSITPSNPRHDPSTDPEIYSAPLATSTHPTSTTTPPHTAFPSSNPAPEEPYDASLSEPFDASPSEPYDALTAYSAEPYNASPYTAHPVTPATSTTTATPSYNFTSPIQPVRSNANTTLPPSTARTDASPGTAIQTTPILLSQTHRPLSNLAAAVAEAVGPLGRIPAGSGDSSGKDKKGGSGGGGGGGSGIGGAVGDGVTRMLVDAGVGVLHQQQQRQRREEEAARRGSSLTLAIAETGVDEKGGGVVSGGDGMVQQQQQQGVGIPIAGQVKPVVVKAVVDPKEGILGTFVVLFDYEQTPGKADEVSIVVGDLVAASNVYEDGWGFGRVLRTNAVGFFPFNAVYPVLSSEGVALRNEADVPAAVCGVA